jgi:hypothetical protein
VNEADGETLIAQLGTLGRDLGKEITRLGALEGIAVDAEGDFKVAYSKVFRNAEGSVEDRKQAAICETDILWRTWGKAAAAVRIQRESLKALHARIEIGRTMVSREKALVSLAGRDGAA